MYFINTALNQNPFGYLEIPVITFSMYAPKMKFLSSNSTTEKQVLKMY